MTIRQEINILNSLYQSTASATVDSGERIHLGAYIEWWDGKTVYFEVFAYNSDSQARTVSLLDRNGSLEVSVSVPNNSTWTRVRSGNFTGSYESIRFIRLDGTTDAGQLQVKSARVIVIQNNFTKTYTQIEIGNKETGKTNITSLPLTYPKYWKYEANRWGNNCVFTFHLAAEVEVNQQNHYLTATLQEDDGNFDNWTDKVSVVFYQQSPGMLTSNSFTPTDGRNYRIVTKTSKATIWYNIYNLKIAVEQVSSVVKLQPQYLIVNTNEGSTGLKRYDNLFDPADWSGVSKDFYHEINSSIDTTDSAKLQRDPGGTPVDIPNSTATGANRARSLAMTMPDSAHNIGTNVLNVPIYASRIVANIDCGVYSLTIQALQHDHILGTVTLSQVHNLIVQSSQHVHGIDNVAISTAIWLAIQDMLHSNVIDGIALLQIHNITISDLLHSHVIGTPTLSQIHNLIIQALVHGHGLDTATLTQVHNLIVQTLLHSHNLGAVILLQVHNLLVNHPTHTHGLDAITLNQIHNLTIQNLQHTHSVSNVFWNTFLIVDGLLHGHILESLTLLKLAGEFYYEHLGGKIPRLDISDLIADFSFNRPKSKKSELDISGSFEYEVVGGSLLGSLTPAQTADEFYYECLGGKVPKLDVPDSIGDFLFDRPRRKEPKLSATGSFEYEEVI